jgi:hypothetical protein
MQRQRYLTLSELLQVIRADHRLSPSGMAQFCRLDAPTYRRLEQGMAPTRALFDSLVDGVAILGAVLMGREIHCDQALRSRIRHLQTLSTEQQQVEIARIRLDLHWSDACQTG